MTRINISLDSLNPKKYAEITRGGDLRLSWRDPIGFTGRVFSPIKINTVAIKGANDDEILDFARLTLDKPFQVRFIEMMALGRTAQNQNNLYLSNDVVMEKINRVYRLESVNGLNSKMDGPARLYRINGGTGRSVSSVLSAIISAIPVTGSGSRRMGIFAPVCFLMMK